MKHYASALEAWEKSTKIVKNDEDRTDRTKLKARSVGKQPVPKNPESGDNDTRMKKMEADMSKLSADMKELMQLVTNRQQSVQNWSRPPVQQSSQLSAPPPFREVDTRRFDSAGEGPEITSPPQTNPKSAHLPCWECGNPGHWRRNCPRKNQNQLNSRQADNSNVAVRGLRKMHHKAKVYVKMKLLGKNVPACWTANVRLGLYPSPWLTNSRD